MKKKLYIAAPLFSQSELEFNIKLKNVLSEFFDVFLPQEDAGKIVDLVESKNEIDSVGKSIFEKDILAMDEADIIIAVLDGRVIDEGTSFELGYMFAKGKLLYGIQTDIRKPYLTGNNPMIEYSCMKIFRSIPELAEWAKKY